MMDMIQRIIGLGIGVIVTLILLVAMTSVTAGEAIVPLVIGAIAAFFWPIVVGWFLVRRARQRQQNKIEDEVSRQMNQQKRG
jgi:purine-cytosine permease-like protein